jgi:hypothetical protein
MLFVYEYYYFIPISFFKNNPVKLSFTLRKPSGVPQNNVFLLTLFSQKITALTLLTNLSNVSDFKVAPVLVIMSSG